MSNVNALSRAVPRESQPPAPSDTVPVSVTCTHLLGGQGHLASQARACRSAPLCPVSSPSSRGHTPPFLLCWPSCPRLPLRGPPMGSLLCPPTMSPLAKSRPSVTRHHCPCSSLSCHTQGPSAAPVPAPATPIPTSGLCPEGPRPGPCSPGLARSWGGGW